MAFGAIMGQTPLVETSPLDRIGLYQILGKGSGTWTPQQTGNYLVIVIGPGGDGGQGYGNAYSVYASSGAGGGSGGVAVFKLKLDNLNSYPYEITNTYSKFNNQVTCNSGESGENGQLQKESKGGAGGSVESSIELLLKANGLNGESGKSMPLGNESLGEPNKGASLPLILNFPLLYGGKAGILLGTIQNPFTVKIIKGMDNTVFKETGLVYSGGVGMGGDGNPSYTSSSSNQFPVVSAYTKGKGGDGAIIIQYLGKD